MSSFDLTKPTRQSVKGLVIIFLQSIRQAVRMFWALIAVFVLQKNLLSNQFLVGSIVVLILVLLIVHSILYYLNFYFYVSEGEFILKKGYLKKKVLAIPLERIQSVNTKQNIIQQVLDVVSLEIDTAGTVGKELKIHALEKSLANELQKYIQKEKSQISFSENEEVQKIEVAQEKPVLKLLPIDLLKIGISQNHIKTGLIIIAFGMQIFQQVQDLFSEKAEQYSNEFFDFMSNSSVALITFMVIFFLFVSVIYSLVSSVIKYYDFTLFKKDKTYRIESGLLNKRNVVIPMKKVQQLNWETGPIKQIFGIYKLVFKQAVSGQQNQKKQQLVDAPGCLNNHLELLKSDLFGEDKLSGVHKFYSNKYYFWRLWMFSAWLPFILAAPFLFKFYLFWLGAFVWIAIAAGYCYLILSKQYFNINNYQIRVSNGAISQTWRQMELYKIQAVEFRQTIFQKRRKLASLKLMNAAGSITIPFIDDKLALKMYNYLLYHTENSNDKWM